MCFRSVFYCLLFICNLYLIESLSQPEVTIQQGIVRGFYRKIINDREIIAFEGIPYAKPPAGKHRFKEPVPASPWLGIYNATREPPSCLQLDILLTKTLLGSEDCLYINVYTPKLPNGKTTNPELLDVLAYIHGGAFVLGKSGHHGPSLLLQKDVVLVTFNYRLGPLGFLSTEDSVVPGNNGLKDQVLALKWIQKNIAAFGGNPNSVTLGGLSAGGASCHYHLLSPLSKGLFHRAICMSGVAVNPWAIGKNSKERAMVIADDLGCPVNDSSIMITCLRNRPAEDIVSQTPKFSYWGNTAPLVIFAPVIEQPSATAFLSDFPVNIIKGKLGSDVPVIFSFTLDEGLIGGGEIIIKPEAYADMLNRWDELLPHILDYNYTTSPEKKSEIGQKIKKYYNVDDTPEGHQNFLKMIGDRFFKAGISKISKLSASAFTSPTYVYRFSYKGTHSITEFLYNKGDLGVSHGDDVFYTLGFTSFNLLKTESDSLMSKQMLDVFTSFIKHGSLVENWEPVKQQLPKVVFTDIKGPNNFKLTTVDELGEESFWDSLGFNENLILPKDHHDEF
ncbi:esterase FE4 [Halyomorpha halys]|uniref:esterase FE4 n=1 Tax=Halyomorpha halys TaxID=286706 RepID=UPI0006D50D5D|nr:esterase FE4-like [Halyomorpha halys]